VDLLRLIDPEKDMVQGKWHFQGKTLVSPSTFWGRLQVPYVPPEEYTLHVVVERKTGNNGLVLAIIAGGNQCFVELDGWPETGYRSGISNVDRRQANMNETAHQGPVIQKTRTNVIQVSVRKTGITTTVNGKVIIAYKGDFARLSPRSYWALPNKQVLGIGAFASEYHITRMELNPVSKPGKVLNR
jgi:hypothetical protein